MSPQRSFTNLKMNLILFFHAVIAQNAVKVQIRVGKRRLKRKSRTEELGNVQELPQAIVISQFHRLEWIPGELARSGWLNLDTRGDSRDKNGHRKNKKNAVNMIGD